MFQSFLCKWHKDATVPRGMPIPRMDFHSWDGLPGMGVHRGTSISSLDYCLCSRLVPNDLSFRFTVDAFLFPPAPATRDGTSCWRQGYQNPFQCVLFTLPSHVITTSDPTKKSLPTVTLPYCGVTCDQTLFFAFFFLSRTHRRTTLTCPR